MGMNVIFMNEQIKTDSKKLKEFRSNVSRLTSGWDSSAIELSAGTKTI
jgi:hypothetical protein